MRGYSLPCLAGRHAIFALTSLLGTGLATRVGAAQTSAATAADPREEQRTTLYREGVSLADTGQWEEALMKFQAVVTIRSAPAALIALATAQEKVGKVASARRTYQRAEREARAGGDEELAKKAAEDSSALQSRVPRLVVSLPVDVPRANLAIDGGPVDSSTDGIEVDPGRHRLTVTADGRAPFERELDIGPSERKEITASLPPARAQRDRSKVSASPEATERAEPSGRTPIGPLVLGGAGLAASIAGLVVRFSGQAAYDDASKHCPNDRCPSQSDVNDGNAARDRMLAGTIVLGVGVAAVAAAGVWWALPASKSEQGAQSVAPRFRVGVTSVSGGALLGARGHF